MTWTQAEVNTWSFSEVTDGTGLGDMQVEVTNVEGRAIDNYEILMAATFPFYVGEVRQYGGVAIAGTGLVNIEHRRVIRTAQIEVTDTFVVDAKVYFSPGGSGAAGLIVDAASKAAGDIEFGIVTEIGGVATAHTYLQIRPFAYNESRILET